MQEDFPSYQREKYVKASSHTHDKRREKQSDMLIQSFFGVTMKKKILDWIFRGLLLDGSH